MSESSWLSVIGEKEIRSDLTRPGGVPPYGMDGEAHRLA